MGKILKTPSQMCHHHQHWTEWFLNRKLIKLGVNAIHFNQNDIIRCGGEKRPTKNYDDSLKTPQYFFICGVHI